jgi:hypothetical protein
MNARTGLNSSKTAFLAGFTLFFGVYAYAMDENEVYLVRSESGVEVKFFHAVVELSTQSATIRCKDGGELSKVQSDLDANGHAYTVRFPTEDQEVKKENRSMDEVKIKIKQRKEK